MRSWGHRWKNCCVGLLLESFSKLHRDVCSHQTRKQVASSLPGRRANSAAPELCVHHSLDELSFGLACTSYQQHCAALVWAKGQVWLCSLCFWQGPSCCHVGRDGMVLIDDVRYFCFFFLFLDLKRRMSVGSLQFYRK